MDGYEISSLIRLIFAVLLIVVGLVLPSPRKGMPSCSQTPQPRPGLDPGATPEYSGPEAKHSKRPIILSRKPETRKWLLVAIIGIPVLIVLFPIFEALF